MRVFATSKGFRRDDVSAFAVPATSHERSREGEGGEGGGCDAIRGVNGFDGRG